MRTHQTLVVTTAACLALTGCAGDGDGDADSADPTATVTVTETLTVDDSDPLEEETEEPADEETTEFTFDDKIRAKDFEIKLRIREKECFGSAGCSITYQINPEYVGLGDIESGSYDITYQVMGGEDGPQINTFTIIDGQASFDEEENISTRSSTSKLTAKVTEVYEN